MNTIVKQIEDLQKENLELSITNEELNASIEIALENNKKQLMIIKDLIEIRKKIIENYVIN